MWSLPKSDAHRAGLQGTSAEQASDLSRAQHAARETSLCQCDLSRYIAQTRDPYFDARPWLCSYVSGRLTKRKRLGRGWHRNHASVEFEEFVNRSAGTIRKGSPWLRSASLPNGDTCLRACPPRRCAYSKRAVSGPTSSALTTLALPLSQGSCTSRTT